MSSTRQEILESIREFNATDFQFPSDKNIIDIFSLQVESTPDHSAVVYKDTELTFRELDTISSQFANYLKENQNINPSDLVGLMIDRSEWVIISILSILKAGGVYVPIDIEAPKARIEYVQNDSNCKFILDNAAVESFINSKENYSSELSPDTVSKPNDLAYIIYTSGTTGNPKGVMIEHRGVVNLITWMKQYYGIEAGERISQIANYYFDASVEQIFLGLLSGAALIMIDSEVLKNHKLTEFVIEQKITHLHATASYLETISDLSQAKALRRIISAAEVCTTKLAEKLSVYGDFHNKYGPTETTVASSIYKYSPDDDNENSLSIGKPLGNTKIYIVNDELELCPIGETGELCISGIGVGRGYLNLEKLTSERFIDDPFDKGQKLYRTGDFAKWLPSGNLEIIGRKDDQVKIRGYRIELGDVENVINAIPNVKRAVVIVNDAIAGEKRLVAYIQPEDNSIDNGILQKQLEESLPSYMMPSILVWMDDFPQTSNGKIDKRSLPDPSKVRPENAPILKKPRTKLEKDLSKIWSEILCVSEIGVDDNFFEMGGTSLLTKKLVVKIIEDLKLQIPITKIYQYPTIAALADSLEPKKKNKTASQTLKKNKRQGNGDIAIIGMAGRFPGADSIEELWEVLKDGKETISFFTPEELDKSIPEELRNDPLYVAARGIVPSAQTFDAKFFGLNPKLASAMDPQQRLFLEVTYEALEKSGYLPNVYDGKIGVYAGVKSNTYFLNNVFPNKKLMGQIGSMQAMTINDKGYIATRTAYHLNLKGPAVSVHSACSTSLLAISQAVEAIRNGQCDVALAGGSSVTSPMYSGHLYQEGSMKSADGHCRPFDANSTGTMFCDGAAVVLLKSLEEAKRDGDIIHGVIKGIGINNDGGDKGSFTAPSIEGEAGAISTALLDADVKPSEISYVEAHGTATPLGDPIEIEGLRLAFGEQESNGYCAVGSIKSNFGHLTAAAGVAGVIKTILAMKHRQIPASLGYENPNPAIDFENSPFFVNDKLRNWESDAPRRAGVSSFGVGGTNVHIVMEEYTNPEVKSPKTKPLQLLTWSAKSENSLEKYQEVLGNYTKGANDITTEDLAYSLTRTRGLFSHRSFTVADSLESASNNLLSVTKNTVKSNELKTIPSHLAFLFPGQGAQYLQMGKALYENEPVFKNAFDACAKILNDEIKLDIKAIIYPENNSEENQDFIKNTRYTQPALFVIEYALAQLFMSWNIKPTILIGHSIGEFVAAHLAGVMSLKEAVVLVAKRGKLVSELPGGSMLSIRASAETIKPMLPSNLSIAAINSDSLCVVSGPDEAAQAFSKTLKDQKIANMLLLTSHAFHSEMMNPALDDFKAEVEKVTLKIPKLPIISTVTGEFMTDAQATDVNYWVDHMREAVDFSAAMDMMLSQEGAILLEVGPGRALTTLSKQKKGQYKPVSISTLTIPNVGQSSYHTALEALGQLWLNGLEPDWKAYYGNVARQHIDLPSYQFDRKPCWIDPIDVTTSSIEVAQNININDLTSTVVNQQNAQEIPQSQPNIEFMRKPILLKKIAEIIEDNSGIEIEESDYGNNFIELGLDSLVLTQMAISLKNEFSTPITFRQLNAEFESPNMLADHLDEVLPEDVMAPTTSSQPLQSPAQTMNTNVSIPQNMNVAMGGDQNSAINLIAQQIQLLGQQIALMQGGTQISTPVSTTTPLVTKKPITPLVTTKDLLSEEEKKEHAKPFGASPKIEKKATGIPEKVEAFIKKLTDEYNTKTAGSKAYTEKHRAHMSDPRVVTGFKPLTKEMVYPIVVEKSSGNRLWDIDGNKYIDVLNAFGACFFGHQPDFIKQALHDQIEKGFEIGPQHPLAGEVCELLCEFTGQDRAALCNTGSEAVLGAMRIARTVTGRKLIVAFSKSYHGINDEVIVRGSKKLKTFPAASGIMSDAVQNMLILDYGSEESLKIIKERAHEIAAVLVEPIQSRRPELVPIEFLKEVRKVTEASETVLIFDEIITGFRMHPGGAQAMFGIKADIGTYGKVIGGGMSIGAIVGSQKCMDALDGGHWQFGDDSVPEIGVTYFAGTFVRHPLALASTKASLLEMKAKGAVLQDNVAAKAERLALELTLYFKEKNLPLEIVYYRSLWRLKVLEDVPYVELFFIMMRHKGFHIWDGFPCYMTTAFTEEDLTLLISTAKACFDELIANDILPSKSQESNNLDIKSSNTRTTKQLNKPPLPGARLGFDENGYPAWFVKDKNKKNEYIQIDL